VGAASVDKANSNPTEQTQRLMSGKHRHRPSRQWRPNFYRDTFLMANDIPRTYATQPIVAPDPNCHYLFDVPEDSDLNTADFTRNPAVPTAGQPVRIHITHRNNDAIADEEAELIFVGNSGERRQVHNKEVCQIHLPCSYPSQTVKFGLH
jgi:hypothetical protein